MLTAKTPPPADRLIPTFTIVLVLSVASLRSPLQPPAPRWPDVDILSTHSRWLLNNTTGNWEPVSARESTHAAGGNGVWATSLPAFAISALPSWQSNPVVAWNNARNEFLVVWEDARNGTDIDLYAQRVSSDGSLLGDEILVATGVHDQAAPVLLYAQSSEGYVLLWHHREPGHYRIHGRRLTPEGIATGAPFRVPSDQNHPQWIPGAAYNTSEDEFLVVWEDMVNSALLCQPYSASGTPLGNIVLVSSSPESQWVPPVVTFAPARQEYLVIWDALAEGDIRAISLPSDGTAPGPEYKVTAAPGRQLVSDATCASEAEECLVVWTDERAWETHDADIYAQLIGPDGPVLIQDLPLSAAPGAQRDGRTTYFPAARRYLTVWQDTRGMDSSVDIFAQQTSIDGALPTPNVVAVGRSGRQLGAQVSCQSLAQRCLLVWQDWRTQEQGGETADIAGLLYTPPDHLRLFPWVPE